VKDHEIAQLVNELTQTAREYHDTQQLRERLAQLVVPHLKDSQRLQFLLDNEAYVRPYYSSYYVYRKCWDDDDRLSQGIHYDELEAIDDAIRRDNAMETHG
jgi:hypothetical protein